MTVRRATEADLPALEAQWRAFEREVPPPPWVDVDEQVELAEVREIVRDRLAFLAEEGGDVVGYALARRRSARLGYLSDLYVRPERRRDGVAASLVHAVVDALAEEGIEHLELDVQSGNAGARTVYQRWGFVEQELKLAAPVDRLRERLAPGRHAESFASIHVQTDDLGAVERAALGYGPRIGSRRTRVEGPRNGWVAVYDEMIDADPSVLLRFARELSDRMGAVVVALSLELDEVVRLIALDRGGVVDEYLSVPEFYGALPPGDVIGMQANPTVLARLTGADPARVKTVAPTAHSSGELPPPHELLAALASALGIEGADHGY
jgi:[ribosomal protein S18]-alanine N-acetyltransferase